MQLFPFPGVLINSKGFETFIYEQQHNFYGYTHNNQRPCCDYFP